jgi:O-antigen ligase
MVASLCAAGSPMSQLFRCVLIHAGKRHIISPLSTGLRQPQQASRHGKPWLLRPAQAMLSAWQRLQLMWEGEGEILRTERAGEKAIFYTTLILVVLVPLTFSRSVYRVFTLPRFIVLLIGAAILLFSLALRYGLAGRKFSDDLLSARPQRTQTLIAFAFLATILLSAMFGAAPSASFWGSFENQMGFLTHFCFLVVFMGIVVGIGKEQKRLQNCLLGIAMTGLLISIYAIVQFFGSDPFLPASLYLFDAPQGKIIRVISSLGHSNYLGNLLLYTTFVSAGLALVTEGSARRVLGIGAMLSLIAIVMSGTRGAWLGFCVGLAYFFIYEIQPQIRVRIVNRQKRFAYIALGALLLLTSFWIIASNQYSNPLLARARSTVLEGFTGSGRTILWRDSLHMMPRYWLIGCGPEGFRKAFLAYKSKALAQLAPQINNESPHNAYLDAMLSFGLPGGLLYLLLFGSSFYLLVRARRLATDRKHKILVSGLLASLLAVAVHNFFIFDQIPTGLYFFVFAALAQASLNVVTRLAQAQANGRQPDKSAAGNPVSLSSGDERLRWTLFTKGTMPILRWATVTFGFCLLGLAIWYCVALVGDEVALKKATDTVRSGNLEKTLEQGAAFDPKADVDGSYGFAMARALALSADMIQAKLKSLPDTASQPEELLSARILVIELATRHTRASIARALTPDSSYLLLAYLANVEGNYSESERYARATLVWDRYAANAHWLLAAARLAQGDQEEAVFESEQALELNPFSGEARQVFKQARGISGGRTPVELLGRALKLIEKGNRAKAKRLLARADRLANGSCQACQEASAKLEEAERRQP